MIKNYFKVALRNLAKHKSFSLINIAGLGIGIAASIIIFTIVNYELSYDKFQPNYKNIYHVVTQDKYSDGGITYNPGVPVAVLDALRAKMAGVSFAAINSTYASQVSVNNQAGISNKKFIENQGIFFCEPSFFNVFHYNWMEGNAAVLNEPNTVVLSKKIAEKYFGQWQQAINKTITLDNAVSLKVAGILQDLPSNTDFPLGVMISYKTLQSNGDRYNFHNDWNTLGSNFQVFLLLPPSLTAASMDKQLLAFSEEHYKGRGNSKRINFLQPLSQLHFDHRFDIFGDHITSMSTLWTLSLIGIFIIIMACINFINLATAQAVSRSKEIGIRKVLGSNRLQLFLQVMGETAMIVFIALLIAVMLASVCLPFVKHIASIQENLSIFNLHTFVFVVLIIICVTILSGLYPSLILSRYNPLLALKNKISSASIAGISLRRSLVVLQFAISQILIIATIVAIGQMNFVNHADLGFNKDAVFLLSANADSAVISRMPAFKENLLHMQGIQSVSFNTDAPSSDNTWSSNFAFNHKDDEKFPVSLKFGDEDYFKTFGLQLLAGRAYEKSDTIQEFVINETLLHKLGLKNAQDAIDKDIRLGSGSWKKIVGVVKDFKTHSLKQQINPILLAENKQFYGLTAIKLRSSNLAKTQLDIQTLWNRSFPEYAYTSSFMDENIAKFYEQETHLELLYKIFAALAVFISCLGLYGLVSFMAVQKTKEIGVRKVLGASVGNIIYIFSKEFTILIVIAFVIAAPLAYLIMQLWLNDFTYKINIGISVFVLAIFSSVIIAWITVGYRAIKAAIANPVKSLRTE
ncbi:MAG: ABC transporter permease [Ginsengibacter sp.]